MVPMRIEALRSSSDPRLESVKEVPDKQNSIDDSKEYVHRSMETHTVNVLREIENWIFLSFCTAYINIMYHDNFPDLPGLKTY